MSATKRVTVPVTVFLREESLKSLTAGSTSAVESLSARCTQYLELTADGALTLTSDQISEIERNHGKSIQSGADVVSATEKSAGIREGKNLITITLDPTWVGPIEDRAKECGRTVDDLFSDMAEIAFSNNWIYGLTPAFPPLYLHNYQFFCDLVGNNRPSGEEIESAVRELQKSSRKSKREDVPVLA